MVGCDAIDAHQADPWRERVAAKLMATPPPMVGIIELNVLFIIITTLMMVPQALCKSIEVCIMQAVHSARILIVTN